MQVSRKRELRLSFLFNAYWTQYAKPTPKVRGRRATPVRNGSSIWQGGFRQPRKQITLLLGQQYNRRLFLLVWVQANKKGDQMENITSKIRCFSASYYGYEHSFHQEYWKQDWSDEFDSLGDALQYIANEDCGEVSIDGDTIYEDGEFKVSEEEIIRMVKEAEASYVSWLMKELDRMLE